MATSLEDTVPSNLFPELLNQQINTSSSPLTNTFVGNPLQMRNLCQALKLLCVQYTKFLLPGYCVTEGTLAKGSACRWGLL